MAVRRTVTVMAVLAWAVPSVAAAEPLPYRGPHPIDFDGAWHEEESVHVHDDLPVGDAGFARIDGVMVFLADPVDYGYTGTVYTYQGIHPLPARIGGYCGIPGEHRHPFAPEGEFRQSDDGVYHFVGALRGGVPTYRPGQVEVPEEARHAREARTQTQAVPVYPWSYPAYGPYGPYGVGWWTRANRAPDRRRAPGGCAPGPGRAAGACAPPPRPPPAATPPPERSPPPAEGPTRHRSHQRRGTPSRVVVQPPPVEPPI